jgi:ectoine hydroxylase-related dioxygenase (phytanoyl-CoA dioxygenase family)
VHSLDKDGFQIVSNVFDEKTIHDLVEAIEASPVSRSRAGMRRAMEVEGVCSIAADPRLMHFARAGLGDRVFPFRATLFDKSPYSNWLVVWHQDTALPVRERRETTGWGPWSLKEGITCAHAPASALETILAIRLHLEDSTGDNGPLRVLPSTHKLGVLSDEAIHVLSTTIVPFECCAPSGSVILMKPLLVHASSKARSGRRRVLHIEYAAQRRFTDGIELFVEGFPSS